MPIVLGPGGKFVLRCVNNHENPGPEPTTMRAFEPWLSLPAYHRPAVLQAEWPVDVPLSPPVSLTLRAYQCHVCGYVELYAPKAAPAGPPGG